MFVPRTHIFEGISLLRLVRLHQHTTSIKQTRIIYSVFTRFVLHSVSTAATSFQGSLSLPFSPAPGEGKKRDPGDEVGTAGWFDRTLM